MNELREQFFGLSNELGLTAIDRWAEAREFRGKAYTTYYIRFLYNEKEYVMYMDDYRPTFALMNSDRTFNYIYCCRFEFFERALREKCNHQ